MISKHFIVATAGHVDHGKSSLVKALTGVDPDRLPEEKARGITIDLGFAHLTLPVTASSGQPGSQSAASETYHLGIVDVPGHEDFVKNMVAGVGSIDLALLVVAADDGWMPQTEEHLQILNYLGVNRAVIALTKIDLADGAEAEIVAAIRARLKHTAADGMHEENLPHAPGLPTALADCPIVKTSVVSGRGLDELKETLARVLSGTPAPPDCGKPRLPVDRVFSLRGIGTVVTGTLAGGTLSRGQSVVISPTGQATRIRSLQNHNCEVEMSVPGMRTALNLPDVSMAGKSAQASSAGVRRGEVVTLAELAAPASTLDVLLTKSARLAGSKALAARPLKDGALVRVHHGSGNWPARVSLLDRKEMRPGEESLAQLRFDSPMLAFAGDRFIVRDWAEQSTLAGGRVLNAEASRKAFRSDRQRQFLQRVAGLLHDAAGCIEARLERDGVVARQSLLLKSSFSAREIEQALSQLASAHKIFLSSTLAADAAWWKALQQQALSAIAAEHRNHPERPGLSLNSLRSMLKKQLPAPEVFDVLIAELCKTGCVQAGVTIRQAPHRPALPPQLQGAGGKLRSVLAAKPLEPPSRKELAPDAVAQQALRFLLETGEAVEVGEEVVLLAENFNQAVAMVKKFLNEKGSATVSDLRQALGTSRRIMVPLLERLDREGLTQRQGDRRVLYKR